MTDLTRRKKELLNSYNNLCSCYGDIISEQTKTINQLKELMKRVVNATDSRHEIKIASVIEYRVWYNIASEIKQVLGEK